MSPLDSPFDEADKLVAGLAGKVKVILVDFHAEATSEKQAMGWHLDGRFGGARHLHHVPTADARILPNGTAFMTDVGMTGPYESIIGFRTDRVLRRPAAHAVAVRGRQGRRPAGRGADRGRSQSGRAQSIEPLLLPMP